jgi:large-conductance mechanosensitive channel
MLYVGSTTKQLTDVVGGNVKYGKVHKIFMVINFILCAIILVVLVYAGRKAFKTAMKESQEELIVLEKRDYVLTVNSTIPQPQQKREDT